MIKRKIEPRPELPLEVCRHLDDLLDKISKGAITEAEFKSDYVGTLANYLSYNTQPYIKKFRDWGHGQSGGF